MTSAPESTPSRERLRSVIAVVAIAIAAFFFAVAIVYWALPADSLPSWLPGHKPASHPFHGHHHKRHGLAAFLLGLTFLALARVHVRKVMRGEHAA